MLNVVNGGVTSSDQVTTQQQAMTSDTKLAADINEYLRERLIHRRNERLAESTARHLNSLPHQSFFFAFGAGTSVLHTFQSFSFTQLSIISYNIQQLYTTCVFTGHFIGNNNVIDRLRARGFTIERTTASQQIYLG